MAFTASTKRSIDLVVPSLGALGAWMYYVNRKGDRSTSFLVMILVIAWVLLYAITSVTTKAILSAMAKPADVAPTGDKSSGINSVTGASTGFDTTGWVDRLHADVYNPIFTIKTRDAELYEKMLLFGNDDLINMWNDWKARYFDENNETMTQAIDAEYTLPPVSTNMSTITDRLKKLGCK